MSTCPNAPASESQTDRGHTDALREEAEHLDEVGWHSRAQHFVDAVEALDALNKEDAQ